MSDEIVAKPDVVQAIKDSVETQVIPVDGRNFTSRPVYMVPEVPGEVMPQTIGISTLTGLIQFVTKFEKKTDIDFIQVSSAEQVIVYGKILGSQKRRPVFAAATVSREQSRQSFKFGSYMPVEDFIIGLLTGFADTDNRKAVLALVGNLKDESVRTLADDGVTQLVTARQGVSLVAEVKVPNPVYLAPYRSFAEIDQPHSAFILRVQRGSKEGQLPTVGLFETNDGQWEIQAIERISDYLEEEIKDIPVIA